MRLLNLSKIKFLNIIKLYYNLLIKYFNIKFLFKIKKFNNKGKIIRIKNLFAIIKTYVIKKNKLYENFNW